jgi:hypothetical protein
MTFPEDITVKPGTTVTYEGIGLSVYVDERADDIKADGKLAPYVGLMTEGLDKKYTYDYCPMLCVNVNDATIFEDNGQGPEETDMDPWSTGVSGYVQLPTLERIAELRKRYALARWEDDAQAAARAIAGIYALLPAVLSLNPNALRSVRDLDEKSFPTPDMILDALDGGRWSLAGTYVGDGGSGADNVTFDQEIAQLYVGPSGALAERVIHIVGSGPQDDDTEEYSRHACDEQWTNNILDDGTDVETEGFGYLDYETPEEAWQYALDNGQRDVSNMLSIKPSAGLLSPSTEV